jgi:RimJ/RimL family protein N-acetyltransferase
MSFLEPITLKGQHATLEPLAASHLDEAIEAVRDGDMWQLWYTAIPEPEKMEAEIARRLDLQAKGLMLPFAVRTPTGQFAGMTTYMNVDAGNRRVEIGSTSSSAPASSTTRAARPSSAWAPSRTAFCAAIR